MLCDNKKCNKESDQWAVVQFENDDDSQGIEISTVPKIWTFIDGIKGTHCLWPTSNPRKHILLQTRPEIHWKAYQIKMLFECEQYEEALEFENRKEQITDSSENEMNSHLSRQGRKRKIPKNYDFTEDIEKDSSDWSIARPPELPTIDKDGQSRTSTTSTRSLDEDFLKMPPPPPVTNGKVINTNVVDADSNYHHATENNTHDDHRHHIAEREENDNSKSSKEYSGCCDHGRISKDILENSVAVRTILDEHRRILENIGTKGEGRPTIITDFETVPKKPFSLMRKLMKYEDILRNSEEAEKQLETAFFIIGGDANNSIRRGLGK
ncbi:unnamed protein product [Phaedon cochleariae]|uniref:Uncharacterized protein n=1 Tax=Phaedon cochleariae TaxID=80249 RepID=A0A9N9X249_PHACE|nr:unnamed protein product [Phaedon cochleariae]